MELKAGEHWSREHWERRGLEKLPRVGGLYRFIGRSGDIYIFPRRDGMVSASKRLGLGIPLNSGEIYLLVWRTPLEEFVDHNLGLGMGTPRFRFRVLHRERVWGDKECLLEYWDRLFEEVG